MQICYDFGKELCKKMLGLDNLEKLDSPSPMVNVKFFPCDISKIRCFVMQPEDTKKQKYLVANFENRNGDAVTYGIVKISDKIVAKIDKELLTTCEEYCQKGILQALEIALTVATRKGYKRAKRKLLEKKLC